MTIRRAAWTAALFFGLFGTAAAQQPAGFTAQGTLVVQLNFSGSNVNVGSSVALMSRGSDLRLDVLRIGIPGTDPAITALAQQFLPQGTLSVAINHDQGSTTVWSEQKRTYYVFPKATASASVSGNAAAPEGPIGPLVQVLQFGRDLSTYSLYSASFNLAGRTTVNGHGASRARFAFRQQKRGGSLTDLSGDMYFADDMSGFPIRAVINSAGATKFRAQLDLTQVTQNAPDVSAFSPPAGFTQVSDLSGVMGTSLPH